MSLPAPIPACKDLFGLTAPEYRQGTFVYLMVVFDKKVYQNPIKNRIGGNMRDNIVGSIFNISAS